MCLGLEVYCLGLGLGLEPCCLGLGLGLGIYCLGHITANYYVQNCTNFDLELHKSIYNNCNFCVELHTENLSPAVESYRTQSFMQRTFHIRSVLQ